MKIIKTKTANKDVVTVCIEITGRDAMSKDAEMLSLVLQQIADDRGIEIGTV